MSLMRRLTLALPFLLTLTGAPAAQAEVPNGAAFGDWHVLCTAESSAKTSCALTQGIATKEGNRFLAEIGLNPGLQAEEGALVMVLRTPSAMALQVQPGFRIGGPSGEQVDMVWRTCAGDFCTAIQSLDAAAISRLKSANTMIVGYQPMGAEQAVTFNVSLNGVTAGLAALAAE